MIQDRPFEVKRISKHTLHGFENGKKVASAPSMPKLKAKLEEYAAKPIPLDKQVDLEKKSVKANSSSEKFISETGGLKRLSMRQLTLDLMLSGKTDDEVLQTVKTHFPTKKYDSTHVKWYRSNFAKSELLPAHLAPKGSKSYKEWEEKNKK